MIKLENIIDTPIDILMFAIQGMRNPMNSWEYSDSMLCHDGYCYRDNCHIDICPNKDSNECHDVFTLGKRDKALMEQLNKAGIAHRKFMRMMPVCVRITAPLYWWKEFDTYKVGTVSNSCSTMHKIASKKFELSDFSTDHLNEFSLDTLNNIINNLNCARDCYKKSETSEVKKENWWQMIQLLPSSYNQTRNVMLNYEVLANIVNDRSNHKLNEWREFCEWAKNLEYGFLLKED